MTPQVVHGVQLRGGPRQQPHFDPQALRIGQAGGGLVLAGPILEQDDVPTPPLRPDQRQKPLVRPLVPRRADPQRNRAAVNVDGPMQDALVPVARDRHPQLLPDVPVGGVQGRRLGDDGLVEHQQQGTHTPLQAAFEPPFDCRQVAGRRTNSWRGRFQRIPSRARARLTLLRETDR